MTSRQTGQKISQQYARRAQSRTGRRQAAPSRAQKRRLAQFLVCGAVFVLLVAVKLLLPARMAWLSSHMRGALERSMDVTEVFSAAGRWFAGDGQEGLEELYRSVFLPQADDALPASAPAEEARTAGKSRDRTTGADDVSAPEDGDEQAQQLSYLLYSSRTLPEDVSLEQRVLGFDYCAPVAGTLSSGFGYREHPVEGGERFHYGLDLAADEGTDILCFADGTVTAVGESSSYGKYLSVQHSGGVSTLYAHCSRVCVSSGTAVKKGGKIAEVGSTGEATGPHLHFELMDGGKYLDPIYYAAPK